MPKKKSMSEKEAKKLAQSMGLDGPSTSGNSSNQSNESTTNKSQGWWNEPIRHALSAQGIQTTIEGEKEPKTDYGSIFLPSDEFNKKLKGLLDKLKSPQVKEAVKDLLRDVDNFEELKDNLALVIEDEIGHIKYKYQSQKDRNQLVNGNFRVTEDEYKELKETKGKVEEDLSTIEGWVDDLETDLETEKNDARNDFEEYTEKARQKVSDDKKYRLKIQEKLGEIVVDLNQKRADLEYAEAIKDSLEDVDNDVQNLYNDAIKKGEE